MPLHGLGVPPIPSDYEPLDDGDIYELAAFSCQFDAAPDDGGPTLADLGIY